jgi:hypothetical protein
MITTLTPSVLSASSAGPSGVRRGSINIGVSASRRSYHDRMLHAALRVEVAHEGRRVSACLSLDGNLASKSRLAGTAFLSKKGQNFHDSMQACINVRNPTSSSFLKSVCG